jgi:hypothetical protein
MSGDPLPAALLTACACACVAVAVHFALFHLVRVERRSRTLVGLFAAAALGHLAIALSLGVDGWRALYGVIVVFCAFILYMPFYYMLATSQSLGILVHIAAAGGTLPIDEILGRYASSEVVEGRLETLVRSGYLFRAGGHFAPTTKGRLIARIFSLVKWLWRLGPGG